MQEAPGLSHPGWSTPREGGALPVVASFGLTRFCCSLVSDMAYFLVFRSFRGFRLIRLRRPGIFGFVGHDDYSSWTEMYSGGSGQFPKAARRSAYDGKSDLRTPCRNWERTDRAISSAAPPRRRHNKLVSAEPSRSLPRRACCGSLTVAQPREPANKVPLARRQQQSQDGFFARDAGEMRRIEDGDKSLEVDEIDGMPGETGGSRKAAAKRNLPAAVCPNAPQGRRVSSTMLQSSLRRKQLHPYPYSWIPSSPPLRLYASARSKAGKLAVRLVRLDREVKSGF